MAANTPWHILLSQTSTYLKAGTGFAMRTSSPSWLITVWTRRQAGSFSVAFVFSNTTGATPSKTDSGR